MRTGTPKSRRPLKASGKPFQTGSVLKGTQRVPVKAKAKSFDFTSQAGGLMVPRKKRGGRRKSNSRTSTPREKEVVVPPKSASHRRRVSQPDPSKHLRKFPNDSVSVVAKFAIKTRQGVIPGNPDKVNQDAAIACPNLGPNSDISLFGVCDGHGLNGHFVSAFVKQRLPLLISQNPKLAVDAKTALYKSILQCNEELKQLNLDINFSGTTLVLVMIQGHKIWCANVGDSRAVLARQLTGNSQWMAVALSRDHKPDLPEEAQRINKAGGRVQSYLDEDGEQVGPARVWLKLEDIPGLAMSRSLGDLLAASVGVVSTPEILELQLTAQDRYIVLGSDGVFEFISNEEAVKMTIPYWKMQDPEGVVEILERESVSRWRQEEEVIDDITSICVFLDI